MGASTVPEQAPETAARQARSKGWATRWLVDNEAICEVADVADDPFGANPMLDKYGYRAYIGLPLVADGEAVGVLYALHERPYRCSPAEVGRLERLAAWASLAVAEAGRAERAHVEAGSPEPGTLPEMISICMFCKNVRSSSGLWERIEEYLAHRLSVKFSHGI